MVGYTLLLVGGVLVFVGITGRGKALYKAFGLPVWWEDTAPPPNGAPGTSAQPPTPPQSPGTGAPGDYYGSGIYQAAYAESAGVVE